MSELRHKNKINNFRFLLSVWKPYSRSSLQLASSAYVRVLARHVTKNDPDSAEVALFSAEFCCCCCWFFFVHLPTASLTKNTQTARQYILAAVVIMYYTLKRGNSESHFLFLVYMLLGLICNDPLNYSRKSFSFF